MVSSAQQKANRKNALKSTGPKKTGRTRFNALKHGILTKEVIVQHGPGKENVSQFNQLFSDLCEQFAPQTMMEEILIQKMCVDLWRLRRVYRAEKNRLLEQYYDVSSEAREKLDREFTTNMFSDDNFTPPPKSQTQKLLDIRHAQLQSIVAQSISREDILSEFAVADGENLYERAQKACEESILFLELCKDMYDTTLELTEEILNGKKSIPTAFETILRYDTTISRSLFRTIRELERLQRVRKGEVIPTLDINIDKSGEMASFGKN